MKTPAPPQKQESAPVARLARWFDKRGWEPFPFQEATWRAYLAGESGLVHAPTGIGKTLAVWGGPLLEALAENEDDPERESFRVLWITPLRALSADTARALQEPLAELGLPWTVGIRTGDTTSSMRAKQRKKLPSALITTPESLSLLLTYPETRDRFTGLRCVVVDEWHELIGSKRGVQTELVLARLRAWFPKLRTWGLSATIGNLADAKAALLGNTVDEGTVVLGVEPKEIEIETLIPEEMERFPWAGHLGIRMLEQVLDRIERAATTLLFTNTRSQTEIWFQSILDARPEWASRLAMHHGSLEKANRGKVERRLGEGELKCVVCTSSQDLGVDFSPVEQVMQVGSPKGVARLIQRAGRSGHQPGRVSRVVGVPTNALELIEFAAARDSVRKRVIEERTPLLRPIDVLAQHLVTVAIGSGFREDEMRREVSSANAYRELSDEEWRWALDFISNGGAALKAYPDFRKAQLAEGIYRVTDKRIIQLHRMNIGTIASESAVSVRFANGKRLGTVEEGSISRLKKGEHFIFAGRRLELLRFREMTALVKPAKKRRGQVAVWLGGKMPLSSELAEAVSTKMKAAGEGTFDCAEMEAVAPVLEIQNAWSIIPDSGRLLIEETRTKDGHHLFVYPFAGRLVHEGLATLAAFRIARWQPRSVQMAFNDYGFELHSPGEFALDVERWREVLSTENLLDDLVACLNLAELAKRQFREVARVAGLVITGYPGRQKSTRALQASSGLLFDVFSNYDAGNLLLRQAEREILERQLELSRLRETLERLEEREIVQVASQHLTPMAFPLWADRLGAESVTTESFGARIDRMLKQLETAATKGSVLENRPEIAENA